MTNAGRPLRGQAVLEALLALILFGALVFCVGFIQTRQKEVSQEYEGFIRDRKDLIRMRSLGTD